MQFKTTVDLTNASPLVIIPGVDAREEIEAGDMFIRVGEGIDYTVASAPTYSAGDTTVTLSAPYAGPSGVGVNAIFQRDYTEEGIALLAQGDVETPAIFSRAMRRVQELLALRAEAADLKTAAYADILGTVSQSGGIPTGALIESGSNSDGYYVILADGTQICWHRSATSYVTEQAVGNIYRSSTNIALTFPRTFLNAPREVSPTATYAAGTAAAWGATLSTTTTTYTMRLFGPDGTSAAFPGYIAIGRWF